MGYTDLNSKDELYRELISQSGSIIDPGLDKHTNICSLLALLKYNLGLFWAGIYWFHGQELKLGPFQGMTACTRIRAGKGACGTAAAEGKTVILKDVSTFPGYISCHSETKSEIVVPGISNGQVLFVLDIDSTETAFFDETDEKYLQQICGLMVNLLN